jgi:hypothetical protein
MLVKRVGVRLGLRVTLGYWVIERGRGQPSPFGLQISVGRGIMNLNVFMTNGE